MAPLISLLIPAFNAEEWIAETLRSALDQTYARKEIIVVDDHSTDHTLEIARSFEAKFVRVVRQGNWGAAAARNKAFELSQGDYIQWLDADDLLAPDKLALQVQALDACDSQRTLLSCAWGRFLHRPCRAQFVPTLLWRDLAPVDWLLCKLGQNIYMQTATWLVSRELAEAAGPWDTTLLGDDDGEYFCRVLLNSDGVRFVPGARVYYRASGGASLSHIGLSDRKKEAQWRSMEMHIGYLRLLEDSPRSRAACMSYLQNWLFHFYPERPDIVKKAEQIAQELGGRIETPKLSWKYSWIQTMFGWRVAKRARLTLPQATWFVKQLWDKALFRIACQGRCRCCGGGPGFDRARAVVGLANRNLDTRRGERCTGRTRG